MLLRFLYRTYDDVAQLTYSVGTDPALNDEENLVFQALGMTETDFHPDAHANRLKIALATMDSPLVCPFTVQEEAQRYELKLNHVSARCRLGHEDEADMLGPLRHHQAEARRGTRGASRLTRRSWA